MTTIYKLLDTTAKAVEGTGSGPRQVEVICSTSSPDRIGDVIVQDGINLTAYKKNPVVLWGHDSDRPVARADKVFIQNGQLRAIAEFPPAGEDADADWVFSKVKNKLVNAVSIGFIPKEWEPVDIKNPWDGYKYVESEMVEFSFVAVPMNAEALIVGRSFLPPKQKGMTLPSSRQSDTSDDLPENTEVLTRESPWRVCGSSELVFSDSDAWDGPAAAERMLDAAGFGGEAPDTAKARRGFLIHDNSADPTMKESYSLPFADIVDGELKAMKGGISAAAAGLSEIDAPPLVLARVRSIIENYEKRLESDTEDGKALISALRRAYRALDEAYARVRKAGRVLNSENEARLRNAHTSIGEVLDMLPSADDDAGSPDGDPDDTATGKAEGSQTLRFPRRAKRELELLKLRSA